MHRHGNCGYKQTYALSQQALGLQNHSAAAALSAGLRAAEAETTVAAQQIADMTKLWQLFALARQ